ncbi:hypothetical protein BC939DRAFT_529957 [Gamsiella multidivaricata]|uniref:uncharacterized protein n=1 Tax=Gamsiella multidivaricata TaxID=101098 RepID=UPI002220E13C|nr:uncharacterized protein BC939DRAFT_529957 [Gamsiella multidivaricata]KAI7821516.1 hypothetical protein BC939DRAFT_529957 [Gamsiella multidivaricata]
MDEAMSSVDVQTDELAQQTIRGEFKDRTILTIAHRIKTAMDGEVVEFAAPRGLLRRDESLFQQLATQASEFVVAGST